MVSWVNVFCEGRVDSSFFVRCWFRRRNVDFEVIRTAASGDESFVVLVVTDSSSGDVVTRTVKDCGELYSVGVELLF